MNHAILRALPDVESVMPLRYTSEVALNSQVPVVTEPCWNPLA
jgi:hypothetical protein